jgi:DNA-directed RNA polymerase I, II, and III subunit RPABC2
MSDEDYYSDSISENSDSDNEESFVPPIKKPLFKPSIEYNDSDTDDDVAVDEVEVAEEYDNQYGGEDEEDSESDNDEEVSDDSDIEIDEHGEPINNDNKILKTNSTKTKKTQIIIENEQDDDDDYEESYLQKFDNNIIKNFVNEFHPECLSHNYDEIAILSIVTRNADGIIIDPLHRTIPYLTKYERARILGQRAKQIESGSKPFVRVPENIVDSYIIADLELKEKKIPFIIRRPIPNGGSEYWKLNDLEVILF